VAEAVVDDLETIEVEEQHGHGGRMTLRPGQRQGKTVERKGPVGKAGKRVVEGHVGEHQIGLFPLGDVLDLRHQVERLSITLSHQ
jgi:hypothetical protein